MKIYREIIVLSLVLGSIRCEFSQAYIDKILQAGSQETKRTDNDVAQTKQFTIATFNCDQMEASKQKPTSVHALRPADIELVAAIGDSLTAANGAKARSILGLLEENRGVSWSIGSEYPDVSLSITLPNILKKFNPLLYGASTGTGKVNTSVAYLNVAQPGHTSYEMWGQAYLLVARMREMPLFREYWKIVTFFVGGNDLCQSCGEEGKFSVANYTKNIRETLDYFQNNLPKTLVNLVLTLDVTGIEMLPGATCRNMQSSYCSCGLSQSFRPTLNNLTASYQKSIEDLIASGRYDTKEDFTVVLQPFMKKMKPPTTVFGTPDYSYFAPDCFHLSAKGHQAAAIELWNSMLTPVGKKKELWTLNSGIKCPTENQPFIFTNKNSQ